MARTYLIAGNWKMHTTPPEARTLATAIAEKHNSLKPPSSVQTLICPPYISIHAALEAVAGSGVHVGAQDCHFEPKGAFTGEIAPNMVKASGCSHVILGHSERRQYFGETNGLLNKKVRALGLKHALVAHRLVARGVGFELGPINGHRAQLDQSQLARKLRSINRPIGSRQKRSSFQG